MTSHYNLQPEVAD